VIVEMSDKKRGGTKRSENQKTHEIKFKNLDFMRFCFRRFDEFQ